MNKNLMAIFYKMFRPNDEIKRNDIVSILGNAEDKPQKDVKVIDVKYQPFSMLYHDRARKLSECLDGEGVFVNIPFVRLYEVLEKLNEIDPNFTQKHNNIPVGYAIRESGGIFQYTFGWHSSNICNWILSDKSGEVPLHRQSKETQDQIYEVLTNG